jgi:hypothetical protein
MKQLLLPVMGLIILSSCNNDATKTAGASDSIGGKTAGTSENTAADPSQAKTEITALVDAVHNGFRQKDFSMIEKSMASNAVILGTDPKEVWPFRQFRDSMAKTFADTSFHGLTYDIPAHQIEVSGNSAIIIDQYQLNAISKKVMTRNLGHARYENGKWLLDMYSWNLIPKNADISKIDKAL